MPVPTVSEPPEGTPHHPPRLPRPHPVPRLTAPARALPAEGSAPHETEAFWADVRRRGTPLVGPDPQGTDDHAAVTFLWRGTSATRTVRVLPNKLGDPRDPDGNLMTHVPGTDVWHWTLRLRHDWRGTYDLHVDEGEGPRRRTDPFNTRSLPHRWDGEPVPYAELPAAPDASDWQPRPGVEQGTVTERKLHGRRVWLYQPPAPAEDVPVLVLLDGEHWQPRLGLSTLLDNLIADGRIPAIAAVLPEAVDEPTRWAELSCRPEYVTHLADELLPWAAARLPITADPARTVIAGQSLGGLTAAYAAVSAPHRFGNALVQSGSFWWPVGDDTEWLTRVLAGTPRLPVRFRLSFGEQEWVALPAARRLRDTLAALGYHDSSYREFNGGHDYLCWRTELADGLVELLGR
ncbi:alpha/beta hydrolase-fold protein [Streptomyces sp. NPDC046909]|uniref:alpha/beta hydrolase-fold protein n=1 Tax=Streptomyces sp. NPDC046909 TaxID=3155617 RepID=UPI0033DDCECB